MGVDPSRTWFIHLFLERLADVIVLETKEMAHPENNERKKKGV
jgi:hypothetical protein